MKLTQYVALGLQEFGARNITGISEEALAARIGRRVDKLYREWAVQEGLRAQAEAFEFTFTLRTVGKRSDVVAVHGEETLSLGEVEEHVRGRPRDSRQAD